MVELGGNVGSGEARGPGASPPPGGGCSDAVDTSACRADHVRVGVRTGPHAGPGRLSPAVPLALPGQLGPVIGTPSPPPTLFPATQSFLPPCWMLGMQG